MIKNFFVILFFIFVFNSCTNNELSGKWYLEGENLLFQFENNLLIVSENGNLLLQAKKELESGYETTYTIIKLGSDSIIKDKYSIHQLIKIKNVLVENKRMIFTIKISEIERKYRLFRNTKEFRKKYFSLLHPVEAKEFLRDIRFENLKKHFRIKIFSSKRDDKKISLLVDGKQSTYWSSQGLNYLLNDFFEFFFILKKRNNLSIR